MVEPSAATGFVSMTSYSQRQPKLEIAASQTASLVPLAIAMSDSEQHATTRMPLHVLSNAVTVVERTVVAFIVASAAGEATIMDTPVPVQRGGLSIINARAVLALCRDVSEDIDTLHTSTDVLAKCWHVQRLLNARGVFRAAGVLARQGVRCVRDSGAASAVATAVDALTAAFMQSTELGVPTTPVRSHGVVSSAHSALKSMRGTTQLSAIELLEEPSSHEFGSRVPEGLGPMAKLVNSLNRDMQETQARLFMETHSTRSSANWQCSSTEAFTLTKVLAKLQREHSARDVLEIMALMDLKTDEGCFVIFESDIVAAVAETSHFTEAAQRLFAMEDTIRSNTAFAGLMFPHTKKSVEPLKHAMHLIMAAIELCWKGVNVDPSSSGTPRRFVIRLLPDK
jgi:hypothetical protein